MRRPRQIRARIDHRYHEPFGAGALIDGAGARRRREALRDAPQRPLQISFANALDTLDAKVSEARGRTLSKEELLARLRQKAIPELTTVDEIHAIHETVHPEAPVYRVHTDLLGTIGVAGVLQAAPNIEKVGINNAIGAHFDEYRHIGANWTAWTSIAGRGVLRACFLDEESFLQYQQDASISGDQFSERSQRLRTTLGSQCLTAATAEFTANYQEGDTFLLWHGSLEPEAANPGVHSFDRTEEGVYTVHAAAHTLGTEVPAGFTRLN